TVPGMVGRLVRLLPLDPDLRVLGFLLLAAVGATLVFGLAPALKASSGKPDSRRPSRLRNALVVTQVAVCSLLLIVAGVLLRGSAALERYDPGFDTHNVVSATLQSPPTARFVEEVRSQTWSETSALAAQAPLLGRLTLSIGPVNAATVRCGYNFVSPEYFDLLKIPVVRGRVFNAGEARAQAPVVLISEATARQFWPRQDPIGEIVRIEPQLQDRAASPSFRRAQIIGIVHDISSGDLSEGRDTTMFYLPAAPGSANAQMLLVRMKADTEAARRALNAMIEHETSGARLTYSLDEIITVETFPFKLSFAIAAFLGVLALALAVSGVYGVLSFLVMQRRREIGIRIALGAPAAAVVRLVLGQSARFALWGAAIGAALALGVSRIFASLLEEINTYEPLAYGAGIIAVFAAALAAAYWPSRRAARIDPASTLRCE
ncbi:MAG: ABC transporter permease, partial [Acidobacteriia bacterium]|nr:ABC transporter permease [Terriglobia bacterium]